MVSFHIDDLKNAQDGHFLEGRHTLIIDAYFVDDFDYGGTTRYGMKVTALKLVLLDSGEVREVHYTLGKKAKVHPQDNHRLAYSMSPQSNGALFFGALADAGFSQDKLRMGDVSLLIGLNVVWGTEKVSRPGMIEDTMVPIPLVVWSPDQLHPNDRPTL